MDLDLKTILFFLILLAIVGSIVFFKKKSQASKDNHRTQKAVVDDHVFEQHFEAFKKRMLPNYIAYYLHLKAAEHNYARTEIKAIYDQYGDVQILPQVDKNELLNGLDQSDLQRISRLIKKWASSYDIQIQETSISDQMQKVLVKSAKADAEVIFEKINASKHS
jgi:hypothetical protein